MPLSVPQFILDALILSNQGAAASIVITQPRRLSAIGVAARVSAERLEDGSVGYAIRGESKQTQRTKLLFCTTGVVLRRLGSGDKLNDFTHVIVDEVRFTQLDVQRGIHTYARYMNVLLTAISCCSSSRSYWHATQRSKSC